MTFCICQLCMIHPEKIREGDIWGNLFPSVLLSPPPPLLSLTCQYVGNTRKSSSLILVGPELCCPSCYSFRRKLFKIPFLFIRFWRMWVSFQSRIERVGWYESFYCQHSSLKWAMHSANGCLDRNTQSGLKSTRLILCWKYAQEFKKRRNFIHLNCKSVLFLKKLLHLKIAIVPNAIAWFSHTYSESNFWQMQSSHTSYCCFTLSLNSRFNSFKTS